MKIIEAGGEYGKRDIYKLTKSPTIQKLSAHDGEILKVDKYVIYEDSENRDDPIIILSIQSGETVIATNSATAIREFRGIVEIMEGEEFSVRVLSGTAKSGRTYYTLELV